MSLENHKEFGPVGMYCHPVEELQNYDNAVFALFPSAALIPECSAWVSLICAAVEKHSSTAKMYNEKHYSPSYQ